jgi:hypothetical protein
MQGGQALHHVPHVCRALQPPIIILPPASADLIASTPRIVSVVASRLAGPTHVDRAKPEPSPGDCPTSPLFARVQPADRLKRSGKVPLGVCIWRSSQACQPGRGAEVRLHLPSMAEPYGDGRERDFQNAPDSYLFAGEACGFT